MAQVTYKNLYQQVDELVTQRLLYRSGSRYPQQLSRSGVAPIGMSNSYTSDASTGEVMIAVQSILGEAMPARIISGLNVLAFDPPNTSVLVTAGKGTAGGSIFEIIDDISLPIDLGSGGNVRYINVYKDQVLIEKTTDPRKLTIAKIVIPLPGRTEQVVDKKDNNSWDAYIIQYQEYKLYGDTNGQFEEETVDMLRNNMGPLLADNLIGNIRLSEDLKITNTAGTMELNSNSLKLLNTSGNVLSKFNQEGVYFYNSLGSELARFAGDGARIGNIVITRNTIQSENFVSGALGAGFQIKDSGDAEFNNVVVRGKISASVFEKDTISVIGGSLLVMDGDVLDVDMTALDSSTLTLKGDTTLSVNDVLRIKDGIDDEWMTVTAKSGNTYTVTRDRAGVYAANQNPAWKKGSTVVNFGETGQGGIYLTSSEANSPYMSIVTHAGSPWAALTTHLRIGNLNGFLGYTTELYGIGIGTTNSYMKYDPTNGLQIKGNITITAGTIPPKTFYQVSAPTNPTDSINAGDYWVDTDASNQMYIFQSNAWVAVGAAGSGITSFSQAAIPVALAAGDLWLDTDDGNKLYRAAATGADEIKAGEWILMQDASIATAQTTANNACTCAGGAQTTANAACTCAGNAYTLAGTACTCALSKVFTFAQAAIPTALAAGDLWIDTDDSNKLYRAAAAGANEICAGEWILNRDAAAGYAAVALDSSGRVVTSILPGCNVGTPAGAGLFLGADYMGYYSGSAWTAFINNAGCFTFCGNGSNYMSWNGTSLNLRGSLNADDITAGTLTGRTIRTAVTGARIQMSSTCFSAFDDSSGNGIETFKIISSGPDAGSTYIGHVASGNYASWEKDTNSFNVFHKDAGQCVSICGGLIKANQVCLIDPANPSNYSFLSAGDWNFHNVAGTTPYVKRICSGAVASGTTICLRGWCTSPSVLVSINALDAFNATYVAQTQRWSVYATTPVWYSNSASDFGYCFTANACLALSVATAPECSVDAAFGTCVLTYANTCAICVKTRFQLWCNAACANYYYGCSCYQVCYRCNGSGTWCQCQYCYTQPHANLGQIQACSDTYAVLTLPCSACWQLMVCRVNITYADSGIDSGTVNTYVCSRAFTAQDTGILCCHLQRGSTCLACTYSIVCTITVAGSCAANTYCSYVTYCVCSTSPHEYLCLYFNNGGYGCGCASYAVGISGSVYGASDAIQCLTGLNQCVISGPTSISTSGNKAVSSGVNSFNLYACIWLMGQSSFGGGCAHACANLCLVSGCLNHCYCVESGGAATCTYERFMSHTDTLGTQVILDATGCLNWLATAYV